MPSPFLRASCLAAVASAMGSAAPAVAAERPVPPPTDEGASAARIVTATKVRRAPGAGRVIRSLGIRGEWGGGPNQLLVLDSRRVRDADVWLKVLLPDRPNGSTGWIPADAARVRAIPYRLEVSTSRRLVRVFRHGRLIRRIRAVVGAPATPTPHGRFAISEAIRQPGSGGFLGPWALHLTAHSNVLDNYGGGPGRVAIHGRGGASLRDPLGTARSHGCIRIGNRRVRWLASVTEPGTPVTIGR